MVDIAMSTSDFVGMLVTSRYMNRPTMVKFAWPVLSRCILLRTASYKEEAQKPRYLLETHLAWKSHLMVASLYNDQLLLCSSTQRHILLWEHVSLLSKKPEI